VCLRGVELAFAISPWPFVMLPLNHGDEIRTAFVKPTKTPSSTTTNFE
jgi:hypothetical protein